MTHEQAWMALARYYQRWMGMSDAAIRDYMDGVCVAREEAYWCGVEGFPWMDIVQPPSRRRFHRSAGGYHRAVYYWPVDRQGAYERMVYCYNESLRCRRQGR